MRIIVTGGSGFIGTNVVEYFAVKGDEIVNIDIVAPRNKAHAAYWINVDLCDAAKLRLVIQNFSPQVIFHMGARTDLSGFSVSDYSANTVGVQNMIAAIKDLNSLQRIIFASSRLVCRIGYQPMNELDYCPSNAYGESKVLGEKIVREFSSQIPCPWIILRPTSIWGPWFDIPYKTFFLTIAKRKYFHPEGAKILKSFGFVGNTMHILQKLRSVEPELISGKTMYLADYPPINVLEMANKIQSILDLPPIRTIDVRCLKLVAWMGDMLKSLGWDNPPLTSFRLNNLLTPMVHDLDPLKSLVGDLPYTMSDGVEITVDWLRQQGEIT